jgi:hypothetical protein
MPLIVTPLKATCQCTDVFLSDHEPTPSEPAPKLERQRSEYVVKPGETVIVVARWNTKDKVGKQNVGVPVALQNDPRKMQIQFRINLDVHKEVVQSNDILEFGYVPEGQKKMVVGTVTSPIRDKLEVVKLEAGSDDFIAKAVPMTADELKAAGAKSGSRILIETSGKNPVGAIDSIVGAVVKTPQSTEELRFLLRGAVIGDVETDPPGSKIDFQEVTADTYHPLDVKIFARSLKESEELRVGTVKPAGTVTAKIEKNPKYRGWILRVGIKPGAPGGPIDGGSISIVDTAGRERLKFRVTGLIDPAFARSAASR